MNTDYSAKILETIIPFLYRSLRTEKTEFYRQYALTPAQVEVLQALKAKNMTLSDLSEAVMLDSSTLVGVVDRLETQAYLKKKISSKDRRKNIISLTEKGTQLLSSIPPFSSGTLQFLISDMDADQQNIFCNSIEQIADKFGIAGVVNTPKETAPKQEAVAGEIRQSAVAAVPMVATIKTMETISEPVSVY
ncbi:MAG: winged helix DNA-binding protein [Firmicutes bacterium]|nr:winged helix DNA-binding protein [Bacillota bacterium]